jgi:DNA-binding GntR family transcriptional regulator
VQNSMNQEEVALEPLIMPPSLDQQVYETLLEAILSFKLEPGAPLVESALARQLGVSKTPVRAALQRLEIELFVKQDRNYRYSVADFSVEDVYDVYLVRSRLEGLVVYLATPHLTPEDFEQATALVANAEEALDNGDNKLCADLGSQFHRLLRSPVKNEFLLDSLRRLNAHIERGRRLAALDQAISRHSVETHRLILEAVILRERELAEQRMRDHIINFIEEILASEIALPTRVSL